LTQKKPVKLKRIRSRGNLGEKVYGRLKEAILGGELPPGAMLHEIEVTKALNISRTPLREAYNRLKAEGLLEIVPRKGARVARLTPEHLDDLFETREAIETTFFLRSAQKLSDDDLSRIRSSLEAAEAEMADTAEDPEAYDRARRRYLDADRAFHDELIQAAGNRVWIDLYYNIRDRIEFCGLVVRRIPERFELAILEHYAILDALAAREYERGRDLMARHIRNVRISMEFMDSGGESESGPPG
jgi:DNA-binding GntR family transcriptional regulator